MKKKKGGNALKPIRMKSISLGFVIQSIFVTGICIGLCFGKSDLKTFLINGIIICINLYIFVRYFNKLEKQIEDDYYKELQKRWGKYNWGYSPNKRLEPHIIRNEDTNKETNINELLNQESTFEIGLNLTAQMDLYLMLKHTSGRISRCTEEDLKKFKTNYKWWKSDFDFFVIE